MKTFLCIATYFKGNEFLIACKEQGNTVFLITAQDLEHEPWPCEHLDDIYLVPKRDGKLLLADFELGIAHLMRSKKIDRIIAIDDFDVERVGQLREIFLMPGIGSTISRRYRDKLTMRDFAAQCGIPIPAFSGLFNDEEVNRFCTENEGPWMIKPRSQASAAGIKKTDNVEEVWAFLSKLGDERHMFLIEQFRPGAVFHVDGIVKERKVIFSQVSEYLQTPFEVSQSGGIFRSVSVAYGGKDDTSLRRLNAQLMESFGLKNGVFHSEFIRKEEDNEYVFLETAARVGGANLSDMVYHASGVNLWKEWARMESAVYNHEPYLVPKHEKMYSGVIISLSKMEKPDTSSFTDEEIVWRIDKKYHIGFIVQSKDRKRVIELLDDYAARIARDFHASAPAPDKLD